MMIALCVDNEHMSLKNLKREIEKSPDITEVFTFDDELDALEWAQSHPFDIAFLEISMRGIGGLRLASTLRQIDPSCYIIFCTSCPEYALDAFQIHADGYLMKPIGSERIQAEIEYLTRRHIAKPLLTIRCFGGFEVSNMHGQILNFKRTKTKELLAVLVDRKGMGITSKEICTLLWEDSSNQDQKNMQYLWNLFSDLSKALKQADAQDVLIRSGRNYLLDMQKVQCDYYDYLKHPDASHTMDEYMPQYSWAEMSKAGIIK